MIRRRDVVAGASALLLAPRAALAQTGGRKRIGFLSGHLEGSDIHAEAMSDMSQALARLGWRVGDNLEIVHRSSPDIARRQAFARELAAMRLDAHIASGGQSLPILARADPNTPVVFLFVLEETARPVTGPFNRPAGNATGVVTFPMIVNSKRIQLLLEMVPNASRIAVLGNARTLRRSDGTPLEDDPRGMITHYELQAPVPLFESRFTSPAEIDSALDALGKEPGTLLWVNWQNDTHYIYHREIIAAAARAKLPAVYADAAVVRDGGLMSLGPNLSDDRRKVAAYVDRILRGARIADLPVLLPDKQHLAINLKTAAALGLTVPATILARADEVIE